MKKTLKTLVVIIIVAQITFSLSWWNNNWKHRKQLDIYSENNQTQEQVFELKLNTQKLIEEEKLKQDCSDLRIVNQEKTLPLHITNCNTNKTNIYAEINITNHTPEGKTYLYYGYPRADSVSSEFSTGHEDEFEDGERNTHLWETQTKKWYNCRSFCYGESGDPSDDTATIEEKQNHIKIYTKAQTNIYGGEPEYSPRDHAKAVLNSKLPVMNNVTNEAYYYLEHNLGTGGDDSNAKSKVYLTDGSTTKRIYRRYLGCGDGMNWETATYKLQYNKSKDKITLYRSELGVGHNSMTEEGYKEINEWKTGLLQNDGNSEEKLESVRASRFNTSNLRLKFVSYSNALRNTGASYTRTGRSHIKLYFLRNRVKGIKVDKSFEQTFPYLEAQTSWINPIEQDTQDDYRVPIELENKGTFKTTNLTLKPISVEGNLSRNEIGTLEPKETTTLYLNQDIDTPKTTNIRLEADSEENNQILFLDDKVAYFNQTTNKMSLDLEITPNNTKRSLTLNKTLKFHSENTINIPNTTYRTSNPKKVACYSQGTELKIHQMREKGFSFRLGKINNEKKITCKYTLNPRYVGADIEEHREQKSKTVKPLSPVTTQEKIKTTNKVKEPLYKPIEKQMNFKYNYSANKDWNAKDPRSGETEIEPNETETIKIELEKDNVVTKQREKRKQDPEKKTKLNGTAYTVIPIKLNNTDTIKYSNVSWESTETQGWKPIKKQGTTNLEPQERKTIHLKQEKDNVLTYRIDLWELKEANLSLQTWNTTAIINNSDKINYTSVSAPGDCKDQLNCTTKPEVTLEPGENTVEIQAKGDRIEEKWITETKKPVRINQDISKTMKIKTKSRYTRNFTNLSLNYKEKPGWNCTIHRNKVKALNQQKTYNVSTCNGSDVIKLEKKHPIESKSPVTSNNQDIKVEIPIELNNTDSESTYNVEVPLKDLNISKINRTTQYTMEIKPNQTKETRIPFNVSVELKEKDIETNTFPGSKEHLTEISSDFSHHIKDISFIQDKEGDWKNILLYKCNYKDLSKCTTGNFSNWQRIDHTIKDNKIIREGDSLSKLLYVTSYDIEQSSEEDEGGSGSSGGTSGGGSGGFGGLNPALEVEEKDNETQKNQTTDTKLIEKELEIIKPVSKVNKSFKVKVRALNVENCIVKVDNSHWKQLKQDGDILTRKYSEIEEGRHELTVKCSSLEEKSLFRVLSGSKEPVNSTITTASVDRSSENFSLVYLLVSILIIGSSLFLYYFRNRVSLSWVRRRMED